MHNGIDHKNYVKSKMANVREEAKLSKSEINSSKGEACGLSFESSFASVGLARAEKRE